MASSDRKTAIKLIVISDLHLGGEHPYMMSQPQRLADFIAKLPQQLAADESLELVIAGDFIDFLAVPEFKSWTPEPTEACAKLKHTLRGPFAPVFDALARHLENKHRLTILVGNHDVELALPTVQDALLTGLYAGPLQVRFIDDGRAYRIGDALIEHGNRYDGANVNDWEGVRAIRSAQSRNEPSPRPLYVSAGSVIVEKFVNAIKPNYPFIDLLKPQDKLLAYLLFAFEPSLLRRNLSKLGHLLKGAKREGENPRGLQPGRVREVDAQIDAAINPQLQAMLADRFGAAYQQLEQPPSEVGARDWLPVAGQLFQDSLVELIRQGKPIPRERLRQMQATLQRWSDHSLFDTSADDGPYGKAAQRMRESQAADVVIMGHTHLARHHGPEDKAHYINTGTWADLITVPDDALLDSEDALPRLQAFLCNLFHDKDVRRLCGSYADVRVTAEGAVESARLVFA